MWVRSLSYPERHWGRMAYVILLNNSVTPFSPLSFLKSFKSFIDLIRSNMIKAESFPAVGKKLLFFIVSCCYFCVCFWFVLDEELIFDDGCFGLVWICSLLIFGTVIFDIVLFFKTFCFLVSITTFSLFLRCSL